MNLPCFGVPTVVIWKGIYFQSMSDTSYCVFDNLICNIALITQFKLRMKKSIKMSFKCP